MKVYERKGNEINQEKVWDTIAPEWEKVRQTPSPTVINFLKDKKGKILDLGCGSGRNFLKNKNYQVYGTDFSKEMLKFAEKTAQEKDMKVELKKMDKLKLNFPENYFDFSICSAFLHCLNKQEQKEAISELYRVLKPKAEALISVWGRQSPRLKNAEKESYIGWKTGKEKDEKQLRYTYIYNLQELEEQLKKAGFKIKKSWEERNVNVIVEKTEDNKSLLQEKEEILKKPTRTISGVAPVAVVLPPRKCPHGACLFCPTLNAPQSYTPESPAILRARSLDYDSFKQTKARVESLKLMGHPTDKIELIIMGGTFLSYPREFQFSFIKGCYDALNGKISSSLEEAKKLNENAKHRCVALCIETRPDYAKEEHIKDMLKFGATRCELGVQAIDDKIYKFVNRGHNVLDVIQATQRLKQAGFKIGYHLMPGIPNSDLKKDIEMFKKIFSKKEFKPDQIKIYPCQVLKGAELEKLYYQGKYKPYTKEEIQQLLIKLLKIVPEYCRVMRIMREIPQNYLIAGTGRIDLRKDIEEEIRKNKKLANKIKEIRFREVGFAMKQKSSINQNLKLKKIEYQASNGKEIFLQIVNKQNILFGLLRLRLEKLKKEPAMIRELHVYGPTLKLG